MCSDNNSIDISYQCSIIISIINMTQLYERAWKSIITPAKFTHNISSFCPKVQNIQGKALQRIDFNIRNETGKLISAVILKDQAREPEHTIFYFHGNGGSKLQCLGLVPFVCQNNIAVIGFDFIGCGNSDSGYLTYGINEAKDAQEVLREADKYFQRTKLTIWGRSMGAITAIKFAQKNGKIVQNLVLDSPFKSLGNTVKKVMKKETNLPQGLATVAVYFLKKEIQKKVGVNLFDIDHFKTFQKIDKEVSMLFFYSEADQIVSKDQIFQFYSGFKGQKQVVQIFEQHQEQRSESVYDEGVQWIKRGKSKRKGKLKLKLAHMCGDFELQKNYVKSTGLCCTNSICYK